MKEICIAVVVGLISMSPYSGIAQSLPAGEYVESNYRISQLLGKLDSTVSFTIRPLFPEMADAFGRDTVQGDSSFVRTGILYRSSDSRRTVRLAPFSWKSQFNSEYPYGWNDGSMIPSRGYQTQFRGGIFARLGPLSVQLQPEYVFAANAGFQVLNIYGNAPDIQPRFGTKPYSEFSLGQSSVRLTVGPLSVGLSNENIWWGPGTRNALILSNNARGFKHLTLNSVRPVGTPIGSFEMQIIGGKLESSDYTSLNNNPLYSDWRYLAGVNLSYQPKWLPGIFVGLTRTFQVYERTLNSFWDYFPFFTPYAKVRDLNQNASGQDSRDQLTSFYGRWLFPVAHAELYFEYGLNDNAYDFRDFIGSPEHSRAYVAGFTKLLMLKRPGRFLSVTGEVTQMQQNIDRIIRSAGDWYYHSQILQGYTHKGEVLGAGIGPGANLQSLNIEWHSEISTLGFTLERLSHANNLAANYENGRKWVDFSVGGLGVLEYGNILVKGELRFIRSLNYQWLQKDMTAGTYYIPENDRWNFHGAVGVTYSF